MKKIIFIIAVLFATTSFAQEITSGDYEGRKDVHSFIERVAASSNYSREELIALFSQVEKQEHLFEKLNKPAEKELKWHQYRNIFVKEKRISGGVKFWGEHRELLEKVYAETGVPPEIIVAIIGVESFYGVYKGKDPVFDSLVTLAFDYPRRSKFFMQELEQFLLLAKEQGFTPRSLRGSYAGAMGMPQFIASSYRSYAVDFDKDGRVDLFNSIPDIVGSVANYFLRHGWQANGKVARPLTAVKDNAVKSLTPGVKPTYQWVEFARKGLVSKFQIGDDEKVALIKLEQKKHPEYWAGFQNFYVITRYNHSEMYAMAVYQLAKLIRHEYKKTA
ncbi:MAG: membrane-bound lytic murein transglycosylase B [Planctomycetota bacterium]|jgi:membrane-bound lytic murein transglycosylase B